MTVNNLFELLFPSNIYCIACGSIIDGSRPYALCDGCVRRFHWANGRVYDKCGRIVQDDYPHGICADCRDNGHFFEKGYSCVQYGIHERDLLLAFKYGGKAYIGEKIAEIMADRLEAEDLNIDIVIPVPMNREKQKRRGYNQAEIIAAHLSKKMRLPYSCKLLLRTGRTAAMSRLSPEERRMNIENAFSIAQGRAKEVEGKRVLLVDDIYTTGSTADACALRLMDAGAKEVRFISFASGGNLFKF